MSSALDGARATASIPPHSLDLLWLALHADPKGVLLVLLQYAFRTSRAEFAAFSLPMVKGLLLLSIFDDSRLFCTNVDMRFVSCATCHLFENFSS